MIWSILVLEYVAMFPAGLIHILNQAEYMFDGSIFMFGLLLFLEMHWTLGFDWIEDLLNGDMNTKWGVTANL